MPYTADKPAITPPLEEVRARIPGWGVDLNYEDRPAVPMENFDRSLTNAHWDFPERQPERWPRERSIEHKFLTPVFGTACPPKGVSGVMRRYAYTFSEGQSAHWLILMAADRVDSFGSSVTSVLRGRPDNPVTESGVLAERRARSLRDRFGRGRADTKHQWIDPLIVTTPWALRAGVVYLAVKGLRAARR